MNKKFFQLLTIGIFVSISSLFAAATPITTLPITINTPGNYIFASDLSCATTAITITASHVSIDFDGHTLTINDAITGILAQNVSDIHLKNGTIQTAAPSTDVNSIALRLLQDTDVTCEDLRFVNTRRCIYAGTRATTNGVTNLKVLNCVFDHPTTVGARTITTELSEGIIIDNCSFERFGDPNSSGFDFCVFLTDTSDVSITNSQFLNKNRSAPYAIYLNSRNRQCGNFAIENCLFDSCEGDILVIQWEDNAPLTNTLIRNCQGYNVGDGTAIQFFGEGLLVENCIFEAAPTTFAPLLDLGYYATDGGPGSNPFFPAKHVIVKNSEFYNRDALPEFSLISVWYADDVLFDTCLFYSNASGIFPPTPDVYPIAPTIQLGSLVYSRSTGELIPGLGVHANNVRILNSTISGNGQIGVASVTGQSIEPNTSLVMDNCVIDGAATAGIYLVNTISSTIKNCDIKNSTGNQNGLGNGIVLAGPLPPPYIQAGTCKYNEIRDCTVTHCTGTGILVAAGQEENFIVNNQTFSNGVNGFNNAGSKSNQFYDNSSCNNGVKDCAGNIPNALLSHPGSTHFRLHQNSCCDKCQG